MLMELINGKQETFFLILNFSFGCFLIIGYVILSFYFIYLYYLKFLEI